MGAVNLYEKDFFAWTQEQANLIKNKLFDKLDFEHLLEEVESMGASERRELGSRLSVLLMHLLKWKYQPTYQSRSWQLTIEEQRNELLFLLKQNPSLKNHEKLNDTFLHAYSVAILKAAQETGLSKKTFPESCEWSVEQVLDDEYYPN